MIEIYNKILYQPLLNAVIFLYNILPGADFGLAIIVLTVIMRLALSPLTIKTTLSQRAMNKINPQIKEIKSKYKNDTQAQSAAIMKLYKDNNVNPLAGCLPLLIQLPILIALYSAFRNGFKEESLIMLYSFISNPGHINAISLGFIDVTVRSIPLALITGALQFFQLKQNNALMNKNTAGLDDSQKQMQAINSQMLYFFPVMIIIIGWKMPAGLLLYWLTTTGYSLLEQMYIKKKYKE